MAEGNGFHLTPDGVLSVDSKGTTASNRTTSNGIYKKAIGV